MNSLRRYLDQLQAVRVMLRFLPAVRPSPAPRGTNSEFQARLLVNELERLDLRVDAPTDADAIDLLLAAPPRRTHAR